MSLLATATSTHVIADAVAVVAGRRIASGRLSMPDGREVAESYAASLAYDALVRPIVDATMPPSGVLSVNLALKAASFIVLDKLAERFLEGRAASMGSVRDFFIVGASLAASAMVQPMLPGGAGASNGVRQAAAQRPMSG